MIPKIASLCLALAALAWSQGDAPPSFPTDVEVQKAIQSGIDYLLGGKQNKDGSFGGTKNKMFTDSFANIETHHAWTVATTGLVVTALLECVKTRPEVMDSVVRGLDYMAKNSRLKRPDFWDNDNVWGQVFGLQGMARGLAAPELANHPNRPAWSEGAAELARGLRHYQSPRGGWGYYADQESAWRPEWATTFTSASGVVALVEAKAAGVSIDRPTLDRAVRAVARGRLPTGAYTYDVMTIPRTGGLESINDVKGSLGRIQACGYARHFAGDSIPEAERIAGLELLFREHKWLDCALRKPIPHEAWYANAAYFYLYAHYYAALMVETLPVEKRTPFIGPLRRETMKTQEKDGGFWDFYISDHTKPYGTAFGIMTLLRTLPPQS